MVGYQKELAKDVVWLVDFEQQVVYLTTDEVSIVVRVKEVMRQIFIAVSRSDFNEEHERIFVVVLVIPIW